VDYNSGVLVTLTSNRIAYAYWVPKVITFVDTTSGVVFAQPIEGSDEIKLPTADQVTKSGFVLAGWLIDDKKYEPGAIVSIEAVANATALWTEYLSVPVTPEQEQVTEEEVQETVLADTGISSSLWLTVASMLLAAGVVLMRLSRRRV
jgi:LPXTG-motif cell wall-anchored protein